MQTSYIIKVDPDIPSSDGDHFFTRTKEILESPKRWPSHDFTYVGLSYNSEETPPSTEYDVIIVLLERSKKRIILKASGSELADQPEKDGYGNKIDIDSTEFSYTFYEKPNVIIIDNDNWNSAHNNLKIDKSDYESYIILHEIGHAIGKSHRPIPDDNTKPYPIMYQATLGLPDVARFIPYPNESDDI